jgi:hypothetical protein
MVSFAFMALVHELTGSALAVGVVLVLRLLPGAVGVTVAARAAYRWGPRKTMLAMDLARAGMVAAVPLLVEVWWIYLWAFLIEVASLVFLPARDAMIPELVQDSQVSSANSLMLASSYGSIPVGAGAFAIATAMPLSGGLFDQPLYAHVFWLDATTFLVSFEFIRRMSQLPHRGVGRSGQTSPGWRKALQIPLVAQLGPPLVIAPLGVGALFSLGVALVTNVLEATQTQFGVLVFATGTGALIGLALARRLPSGTLLRRARMGLALTGASIVLIGVAATLPLALLAWSAVGASAAYTMVVAITSLQTALEGSSASLVSRRSTWACAWLWSSAQSARDSPSTSCDGPERLLWGYSPCVP